MNWNQVTAKINSLNATVDTLGTIDQKEATMSHLALLSEHEESTIGLVHKCGSAISQRSKTLYYYVRSHFTNDGFNRRAEDALTIINNPNTYEQIKKVIQSGEGVLLKGGNFYYALTDEEKAEQPESVASEEAEPISTPDTLENLQTATEDLINEWYDSMGLQDTHDDEADIETKRERIAFTHFNVDLNE